MEKRKVKNDVRGLFHWHDVHKGFTKEERQELHAMLAQGLDQKGAEQYVRKMRELNRPEMIIHAGEVVEVRAKSHWMASPEDPHLLVVSDAGVFGRVLESATDKVP